MKRERGWRGGLHAGAVAAAVILAGVGSARAQEPRADTATADTAAGDARAGERESPGLRLPVVEDTLANGMRLLVLRQPGAPTVSFVVRYDVGSVNEVLGETGIAHFLEHLLFKGTTTIGSTSLAGELALFPRMDSVQDTLLLVRAGRVDEGSEVRLRRRLKMLEDSAQTFVVANEYDRLYTEEGGRDLNAVTTYDGTTYFVSLPSNKAELWFVMEADRMANPVFREFYAERDVVAEERRQRLETSPEGRVTEEFYAAAYRVHPYGVPVIGHMSDIQSYTRAQVRAYHHRFYGPNNAVVAIVGDVDPKQVLTWAHKYFDPIPPGDVPAPVLANEPPQRGERRVEVLFDAAPQLMVGWHVPDGYSADMPALNTLGRILAGGKTSRLYHRLVLDSDLATSISFSTGPGFRYPTMFTLSSQPLTGHTTAELEAVIYDEIGKLQAEPPTEKEMQRVRNQSEASEVRRLGSHLGLAFQLAESVAFYGDWRETFRSADRLMGVTAADVQRVARAYLTPENRTVGMLRRPAGSAPGSRSATRIGDAGPLGAGEGGER